MEQHLDLIILDLLIHLLILGNLKNISTEEDQRIYVTWSSALVGGASSPMLMMALAADGFDGEVGTSNNQYAQNNTGSNPSTITFTPVGESILIQVFKFILLTQLTL